MQDSKVAGNKHAYRAEIDGLRALAVLSILTFHLRSTALPGGYLGVDIFFVISGYIITRLIRPDVESGRFSIANFYMRRVRRIIPAMAVMLLATLAGGLLILLPYDLVDLAKATIATILFNANHYSLAGAGYFARSSDLKPLNHMWSLGIEEQFYLIFPWVLVALSRLRARVQMVVLASLVGGSMAGFLIGFRMGASDYVFFLLPTRAWELGGGAILSLLAKRPKGSLTGSAIGLALTVFALVSNLTLAGGWLHPSIPAVVGTMMLIRFLDSHHAIGRLLTLRPVRFIGLSSFSIYLWHWPLIAFARYWLIREPNSTEVVALALATLGLGTLSWRYVEERYRSRAILFPTVVRFCCVTVGLAAAAALVIILLDGLPQRMPPDANRIAAAVDSHYRCSILDYVPVHGSRGCRMNLPSGHPDDARVVLMGNSHAQMYVPLVRPLLAKSGIPGLVVPVNLCLPSVGANLEGCAAIEQRDVENVSRLRSAQLVIIATAWDYRVVDVRNPDGTPASVQDLLLGIDHAIAMLRSAGKQVVLIGPIAQPNWDFASITARSIAFERQLPLLPYETRSTFDQWAQPIIQHFAGRADIIFIRPDLAQCDIRKCDFSRGGESLFSDINHVSSPGLSIFRSVISRGLNKPLRELPKHG